ncbi:MAG: hypothetical protein GY906_10590, partial [bacterium]|nr:hypothetical protein [bacterium]
MNGVQRRMCGVVVICCLVVACIDKAPQQIEDLDAEVSYLDQIHPEKEAVVFAPGIVSVEGRYEYGVSFHPDGNQVLFTGEVPDQGAALFRSRLIDGVWSEPEQVSLTDGSRSSEMEAFFSPDGESLFFAPYDEGMDVRIWRADVTPDGFANPRPLGSPVDQDP